MSYKAQNAQELAGRGGRAMNASGVESVNMGEAVGVVEAEPVNMREIGLASMREIGAINAGWNSAGEALEQGHDVGRVRGIGNLAMGQVLTYNPEAQGNGSGALAGVAAEAVVGRDANKMLGVAGESLGELEEQSVQERLNNARIMGAAALENGYARKEIIPNLSSVERGIENGYGGVKSGERGVKSGEGRMNTGEVDPGLISMGLASEKELAERRALDNANAKGEFAPVSADDKLQNNTQEGMGKTMAAEVGNYQRRKSFIANDIVKLRDQGMLKMLAAFKNPRIFKERN